MKKACLTLCLFCTLGVVAQEVLVVANKCYNEKSYGCAVDNYKIAFTQKKYQEKDHALVLYRIGFGLKQLNKLEEAAKYLKDALVVNPVYKDAYWALAGTYYADEEYLSASESYGKAIELYKEDTSSLKTLYYWRAASYSKMAKYADALTYYKLAISIDSNNATYHTGAGDVSFNNKNYSNAVKYYLKAIQIGNATPNAMSSRYYWLGQAYLEIKNYPASLEASREALKLDPTYGYAQWGMAAVYYNQSQWLAAAAEYSKTLSMFKNDTLSLRDIYYFRGRSYYENKDYGKALADYQAILKMRPADGGAIWQTGSTYYRQGKYNDAITWFDKAIAHYKGVSANLDDLLFFRGDCYLKLKDSTRAIADFKESITNNAYLRDPNMALANISFARKKYYDAKKYYDKSDLFNYKADSSELAEVWFRTGLTHTLLAYSYTAKDYLLKSIRFDSTHKDAHRFIADIYYGEKNYSKAESELDKCILLYKKVKDSLPVMHIYRAYARSAQKKYQPALDDYEQSDKLKKIKDPIYIVSMGQLAFELKDYPKTITLFTRVIPLYNPEQKSDLMFAYFGRGRAYLEQKKKTPALADLNKALEFSPGNKDIESWKAKAQAL